MQPHSSSLYFSSEPQTGKYNGLLNISVWLSYIPIKVQAFAFSYSKECFSQNIFHLSGETSILLISQFKYFGVIIVYPLSFICHIKLQSINKCFFLPLPFFPSFLLLFLPSFPTPFFFFFLPFLLFPFF
jgi:hypothetical protein